jgi:hypothetical protein
MRIPGKFIFVLVGIALLVACKPATEEERIAAINKVISPDGHLTKTHLYINWPAIPGKVNSKPLKLKIPVEYLVPPSVHGNSLPSYFVEYFEGRTPPIFIQNHQITSFYLRLLPGAKPYEPIVVKNTDTAEEAKRKGQILQSSYAVTVHRNDAFNANKTWEDIEYNAQKYLFGEYIREPNMDGLLRFVKMKCFSEAELNKDTGSDKAQKRRDELASKASDDHAPENCYSDRENQYLASQLELTKPNRDLYMVSHELGFHATFGLAERYASIMLAKENSFAEYRISMTQSRNINSPYKPFRQPRLDEVFTDLLKWREKIEPTRDLLDSFIVLDTHNRQ